MEVNKDSEVDLGSLGDSNLNAEDEGETAINERSNQYKGTDEEMESVTPSGTPAPKAASSNAIEPKQKEDINTRQRASARSLQGNPTQDNDCDLHQDQAFTCSRGTDAMEGKATSASSSVPFGAAKKFTAEVRAPKSKARKSILKKGSTQTNNLKSPSESLGPQRQTEFPKSQETTEDDMRLIKMKFNVEGASDKKWYLNIGIEIPEEELLNKEVLLGGIASISEVLFETSPGSMIHPLEEDSPLEDLTSHLTKDGFPMSASIVLGAIATAPQNPQRHRPRLL